MLIFYLPKIPIYKTRNKTVYLSSFFKINSNMTVEEIQEQILQIEVLFEQTRYEEAISYAFEILNKEAVIPFTPETVKIYTLLGNIFEVTSKFTEALQQYNKALDIHKIHDNRFGIADCLSNMGNVYDSLSQYLPAIQYHQESLQVSKEIEYINGIGRSLGNIGIVYLNLSDYLTALEYFEQALVITEQQKNYIGIAINLGNIGNVFRHLKEYDKAIEYYKKALQINTQEQKYDGSAINLGNIGIVYYYLQEYELALEYYKKAVVIKEEQGLKHSTAFNLSNIGNVYFSLEDFSKALEYYQQALQINTEFFDKRGIGFNLKNLAFVYFCLNDFQQSIDFVNQSWKLANELQDHLLEMECLELFSMLYEKEENFEQAVTFYKRFVEVKNAINSEDTKQKALLFDQKRLIEEDEKSRLLQLARFQEQEKIFHNILPISIANRLIDGETSIADSFDNVSIFFSDIVGFHELSSNIPPSEIVETLNTIFKSFDRIGATYGVEKIKTIGDVYMAVCGVPEPFEDHSNRTTNFAIEVASLLDQLDIGKKFNGLQLRIGLHCGSVVAGIIGEKKFAYDVWGDAVNIASRMESNSEAGRIHISEEFAKTIEQHTEFKLIPRGTITIKGKGTMNTYWLEKAE